MTGLSRSSVALFSLSISCAACIALLVTIVAFGIPRDVQGHTEPTPTVSSQALELTMADGYIPDGQTLSPFDRDLPAVANLQPDLLAAVQQAATDAASDDITIVITSGWRSTAYQQKLLDDAIITYGSEAEARKWVNTPEASTHVTGNAVDIGYTDADYWLIQFGNQYGLCQTFANEIWHFELMVEPGASCPAPLTDATEANTAHSENPQHRAPAQPQSSCTGEARRTVQSPAGRKAAGTMGILS